MTAPNKPDPEGTVNIGGFRALQTATESDAKTAMKSGVLGSFGGAQNAHNNEVRAPLDLAQGAADAAVTEAQAAANAAANAVTKAQVAYDAASYWSVEFIVASAEVLLGVNELLLGPVLNVPAGRTALLTDIHMGLLNQPNGLTIETRKWNATGTAWTTVHTGVLAANVNRRSFPNLTISVLDKERFWPYVTSITGTVPPTVLQVCVAGAFI